MTAVKHPALGKKEQAARCMHVKKNEYLKVESVPGKMSEQFTVNLETDSGNSFWETESTSYTKMRPEYFEDRNRPTTHPYMVLDFNVQYCNTLFCFMFRH